MSATEEFFAATNPYVDPLWDDLARVIRDKGAANPRHLQRELGPSEVGHPCMRKLAYGLMEVPRTNPEWDPLPSIFGVAMHKWLEKAFQWENERLGWKRWITEMRVWPSRSLFGSADLFDVQTGTVIDWKNLGYTSFDKHVRDPGPTYRNQGQLYGLGYANLGVTVKRVVIAMLPRTGTLTKMHLDIEDYDESIARSVLARIDTVLCMINDLKVEEHPERYEWIPKTPHECIFCPFWSPKAEGPLDCSGGMKK